MSVAPMLKVAVIGYRPVEEEVVELLQRAGVVQIVARVDEETLPQRRLDETLHRRLDEYAADAYFVRDFLSRYHAPTQAFSSFISEKFHLGLEEFLALDDPSGMLPLYRECEEMSDGLASLERERSRLVSLRAELVPWEDVRLQISRWAGTRHVRFFAGTVSASDASAIRRALGEITPEFSVDEHGAAGSRAAWIVLAHESVGDDVRAALSSADFAEASFPGLADYPAEEAARAGDRIEEIDRELDAIRERARNLADREYARAAAMAEVIDTSRQALEAREDFGDTRATFVLEGWVKEAERDRLDDALAPVADAVDISLSEPGADDAPPVELDNPWFIRPFEVLTDLYGRPTYRELDPTPMLAPFFLLFFGICISDVGYGAMLIGGAWYIKNKLDVAAGVRKFMDLLMFGGAGAMVIGVLFGSYFAIDFAKLPPFLQSLQVLDPMKELTDFLIACVVLGVVQVFFGVVIAAYDAWRNGDRLGAIFEQLSILFLAAMIGVCFVVPGSARWALPIGLVGTMLMQGGSLQAAFGDRERPLWDRIVGWAWLLGVAVSVGMMISGNVGGGIGLLAAVSIVALVSHTGRRSVISLLGGAYAVYGMSAFIGDILSYTRLAALGLSGALVGMVFNLMSGMVMSGAGGLFAQGGAAIIGGVIVVVLGIAVFAFGHTFNVVINLLGAFVHPARLQFVEFFSKFYEGGGRPFAPFGFRTKSVVLGGEKPAGQEGG